MYYEHLFLDTFVFLCAAVVSVPLAKFLGLSSVLGYLAAGVAIGPAVLGLVGSEGEDVMHFAEFGVVMMLFLVGLELEPRLLWKLRKPIVGTGGLQVLLSTVTIGLACFLVFSWQWQQALAVGLTLALSSTAIVLQSLQERNLMKSDGGQSSFAVLLFQDIAVIPILAALPLLALYEIPTDLAEKTDYGDRSQLQVWVDDLSGGARSGLVLLAIAAIILAGRFVLRHCLRIIAKTGLREAFTMFALLLVIGIALLMNLLGVSPALGAFVAGVVLATSEYRHELEADIEPFKGILLSIFFIAVGASIDFELIVGQPLLILGLVIALMVMKAIILGFLGRVFRLSTDQNLIFTCGLCQAGEFAFVLIAFGLGNGVFTHEIGQLITVVVALTMAVTPLVMKFEEAVLRPRFGCREIEGANRMADEIHEESQVILAGFGRFGNYVGRFLRSQSIAVTVVEHDSDHVDFLRRIGIKAYYGDASRHDLLTAAGAQNAKLLIITFRDAKAVDQLVETARKHFPNLKILARASDRSHLYRLILENIPAQHEHSHSAVALTEKALGELGYDADSVHRAAEKFLKHDYKISEKLAVVKREHDESTYLSHVRESVRNLEGLMNESERVED